MWGFGITCAVLATLLSLALYGAYRALSEDAVYLEVEEKNGPVYYPDPKPYADKKITQEIIEKSTFQVLD